MHSDPIDPNAILTARQVHDHYGVAPATLLRWIKLRRIHPRTVRLARGECGSPLRFVAGDIAAAVEASFYNEPGSRGTDPMLG